MPTYARVRGLARRGIRVRSKLGGGNAVTIGGSSTITVDLDDPNTRQDIAHHSAIGQLQIVDFVARQTSAAASAGAVQSGFVVTPRQGSLVADVTGGTFLWNDATTLRTVTLTATTVTFGANATANPRTDYVVLDVTAGGATGAVIVTAGSTTFPFGGAATVAAPDVVIAEALIPANTTATSQPVYVIDRRPLI